MVEQRRPLRLVPVIVKDIAPRSPAAAAVVVRVGEHTRMEIAEPSSASAAWIAAVMAELERLSCL
jgi:hypothetical protein